MESSIYRLRTRDILVLCVVSLLLLGVLMVQSASTRVSDEAGWDWTTHALKHIVLVGGALTAFLVVGHMDVRKLASRTTVSLRNPVVLFFVVTCVLCALTLVPGVGKTVNGARRWIGLGPIQVQPSELAKWAVVLLLAWVLAYREDVRARFGKFLLVCGAVAVPCLLVVIQDFGTAALIGGTAIVMLIVARVRWWHMAVVFPPILAVGFWFVHKEPYRWRRITSFLNPFEDARGEGYHMVQSLLSFASGGVFGKGLGNGVQKLGYLPEDTTDFIFAVICEELGLFGALLTIVLYLGIGYCAWQLLRAPSAEDLSRGGGEFRREADPFSKLVVFGVATLVCLQAMINVAVATVSVPTKGLSLPFVSAGGSGLLITGAAVGLIYSVARQREKHEATKELPLLPVASA